MTDDQNALDAQVSTPSVEDLEAKLKSNPNDIDLKEALTDALIDRFIYGGKDREVGNRLDVERVRKILKDLPEDRSQYPRLYLAYLDSKSKEFSKWLDRLVSAFSRDKTGAFNSDKLFTWFVLPFTLGESSDSESSELWLELASALGRVWPESAAVFTLQGLAKLDDGDNLEAIDDFACALEKEGDYWFAAWMSALVYYQEENWQAARHYFYKALKSDLAQKAADIHFTLAWCLGKLKDFEEEEKHYRTCLEFDPDYPSARNNLGWSLYKQGKFDEALEVFEQAVSRGNDGKYPLRNKARALIKLGRFQAAIETLEKDIYRGELTRFAQEEISRLQELIAKQEQGLAPSPQVVEELEESEEGMGAEGISGDLGGDLGKERPVRAKPKIKPASISGRFSKERWLESMIEEMIGNGLSVFERQLRMYYHPEKGYGRQFAIPRVGQIDLLVEDTKTNDLIVIELKRGQSDDQVIGQTSRYMTWVRENLARNDQRVWGIVCVHRASGGLKLSAKNISGLKVYEYDLSFQETL